MPSKKPHHQVLGLQSSRPGRREIKKAYQKKSLAYHPDKNAGLDTKEAIQEINQARDQLMRMHDILEPQSYYVILGLVANTGLDENNSQAVTAFQESVTQQYHALIRLVKEDEQLDHAWRAEAEARLVEAWQVLFDSRLRQKFGHDRAAYHAYRLERDAIIDTIKQRLSNSQLKDYEKLDLPVTATADEIKRRQGELLELFPPKESHPLINQQNFALRTMITRAAEAMMARNNPLGVSDQEAVPKSADEIKNEQDLVAIVTRYAQHDDPHARVMLNSNKYLIIFTQAAYEHLDRESQRAYRIRKRRGCYYVGPITNAGNAIKEFFDPLGLRYHESRAQASGDVEDVCVMMQVLGQLMLAHSPAGLPDAYFYGDREGRFDFSRTSLARFFELNPSVLLAADGTSSTARESLYLWADLFQLVRSLQYQMMAARYEVDEMTYTASDTTTERLRKHILTFLSKGQVDKASIEAFSKQALSQLQKLDSLLPLDVFIGALKKIAVVLGALLTLSGLGVAVLISPKLRHTLWETPHQASMKQQETCITETRAALTRLSVLAA